MSEVYDIGLQIYWDYEIIVCGKNSIPLIVYSKCFSDTYSLFIYPIAEKLCPLAILPAALEFFQEFLTKHLVL